MVRAPAAIRMSRTDAPVPGRSGSVVSRIRESADVGTSAAVTTNDRSNGCCWVLFPDSKGSSNVTSIGTAGSVLRPRSKTASPCMSDAAEDRNTSPFTSAVISRFSSIGSAAALAARVFPFPSVMASEETPPPVRLATTVVLALSPGTMTQSSNNAPIGAPSTRVI